MIYGREKKVLTKEQRCNFEYSPFNFDRKSYGIIDRSKKIIRIDGNGIWI